MTKMSRPTRQPLVFFDGYCNLCSASVRFLIENDPKGHLHFASLQSNVARALLDVIPETDGDPASIVLLENGQRYDRSDAALRAAGYLKSPWKYLRSFLAVPKWLRDPVYNWIARNRYSWFGKSDSCMMPTPENVARFVQESDIA